jgi:AraC-like DNA-binding protein
MTTGVLKETDSAYREWAPRPDLADRLVCAWRDPARLRRQPILPDACIDLVWDGLTLSVAGPDTRAVPIGSRGTFVGVRFRPGHAPAFLGLPASDLLDARVDLAELWGRPAVELREQLLEQPERVADLLQDALVQRLPRARAADEVVDVLVHTLVNRTHLLAEAAAVLGVSDRTLRRRCTDALGYGPKTLERILRFRRGLRLLHARHAISDAAYLAGYADQSHFTNETRRLASATPAVLASAAPTLAANGWN